MRRRYFREDANDIAYGADVDLNACAFAAETLAKHIRKYARTHDSMRQSDVDIVNEMTYQLQEMIQEFKGITGAKYR